MSAYEALKSYLDTLPVVDSHEHLPPESDRLSAKPDFYTLFYAYVGNDLVASGMSTQDREKLNEDLDIELKWELFHRFYNEARDGSYARAVHLSMKQFYGMDYLRNAEDAVILTEKIRALNKPGLYDLVLKQNCKILACLDDVDTSEPPVDISENDILLRVARGDRYVELITPTNIEFVEKEINRPLPTLKKYIEAVGEIFENIKLSGAKGVKFGLAYMRSLHFPETTMEEAGRIFDKIVMEEHRKRNQGIGYEQSIPLQDFLVGFVVNLAGDLGLPVVFHTGYQAGPYRRLVDSDPLLLWNLLLKYQHAKFVFLHGGFPWLEEAALMAKQCPNLYLDMSWLQVNSPEASIRIMKEYVDILPKNRVIGFGGDTTVVENVYGYLQTAKDNVAKAFSELLENKIITEERCLEWVRNLLTENPSHIYGLNFDRD